MRLRRSDPSLPGIARRRHGAGFAYSAADGTAVRDPEVLDRVRALAVPPAWKDVWICPWPHGHLQAVGTDEAGRTQYLYHEVWRARRDREKFARATELGRCLPRLRDSLVEHLDHDGPLTQSRVLATAVRLIDLGLFRVGSEQYLRANGSFGLTTALREHVTVDRDRITVSFLAKSGVEFTQEIQDPAVRRVVRALVQRDDPAEQLLGWWCDDDNRWKSVRSEHVNAYLRDLARKPLTVKDFRTWHATVLMATTLAEESVPASAAARRRVLAAAYGEVADQLHNTMAVTRSSYVDPRVVDLWEGGVRLPRRRPGTTELVPVAASRAVARLLRGQASPATSRVRLRTRSL
ncbi:MAG TPA: DNA topoisomerase IB [Mycobacteriales bacterium]|nr:DNA topoisomerase IB [Mycobacteriales bacterium]